MTLRAISNVSAFVGGKELNMLLRKDDVDPTGSTQLIFRLQQTQTIFDAKSELESVIGTLKAYLDNWE